MQTVRLGTSGTAHKHGNRPRQVYISFNESFYNDLFIIICSYVSIASINGNQVGCGDDYLSMTVTGRFFLSL